MQTAWSSLRKAASRRCQISAIAAARWPVRAWGIILEGLEKPQMERHEETQRREVHYSGRVQGVGFRYTACRIAGQFAVTGYVRNLPDGRVELVAEGRPEEVQAMLRAVRDELSRYIRDVHEISSRATGGFSSFDVRY
jgi:acylphosphatase